MVKIWKDEGLIKQEHLNMIQTKIDEFNVPNGIGRIPYNIGSNFAGLTADGLTADQWMNWTNIFLLHALRDILPSRDIDCWFLFVQASTLLHQYTISQDDITRADEKLMEFLELFEITCGKEYCTPNMHLHAHMKQRILDFWPISAF